MKEAVLRVAGNLYAYSIRVKRGILFKTTEFGVERLEDAIFTENVRAELRKVLLRNKSIGVGTVSP